jgi:UDP-N-acetylglucosamine--N-acetylmuramyl-(pentapeptide) pyrophosphoryl-undecaprenol N-acetylglucosamine transferase
MLHVALIPRMKQLGWELGYVGSKGIEREIIGRTGVPFKTIASGKLRRYFSLENFLDIFRVCFGIIQCIGIFLLKRPDLVFSKGGFVSVPVVVAAKVLRVPVVIHESDLTPGLANRIASHFAKLILYTFPETGSHLSGNQSSYVGAVVRDDLFSGSREIGQKLCGFDPADLRQTIIVIGGSQGAQKINDAVDKALESLIGDFRVVHLAGKGKLLARHSDLSYAQFEFVADDLKHLFALSDFAICRAGANSIFELLALNKPMLLIPLEAGSRGDQVVNAESFQRNGWAHVLRERDLTATSLAAEVRKLANDQQIIRESQRKGLVKDSSERVIQALSSFL